MRYNVKVYAVVKNPYDVYDREEQYIEVNVNSLAEALLEAAVCIKQWEDDDNTVAITNITIKEVNS
jgi:hypothetical protein